MLGWLLQRVAQALLVIFAMSLVVFLGLHAVGNPADLLLAPDATQIDRAELVARLGLDRPLWEFYIGKMRDLFDNQTLGPLYLHLIDHWSDPDDSDTVEMINGLDAGTPALIDSILHDPDYPPSARYRQ